MRIVLISDTHSLQLHFDKLPEADMIVHSGDVSKRGTRSQVLDFFAWYSSLPYRYKIFIAGNHDFLFEQDPEFIQKNLPDNLIYLENSGIEIEGIKFWGSPITPWFYDWAFNRMRGDDILKYWNMIPKDTNYLITHGPPYLLLDKVNNRYNATDNVGCKDLKNKLFTLPDLRIMQFGHIHEARGYTQLNNIHLFNASSLNEEYAPQMPYYYLLDVNPSDFSVKIVTE